MTWGDCPHCGEDVESHLQSVWDYQSSFDATCPNCGKEFGVEVRQVPEFCCEKITNAQRDREAWERGRKL